MKKTIKTIISYLITFLLIGLILYFLKDHRAELGKIANLSLEVILLVSGIFILHQGIQSLMLQRLLATSNCHISWMRGFYLVSIRSFLNYLPLNAGMFSNGVYLKRTVNFPLSQFVGLYAGAVLLSFLAYGFTGLLFIVYLAAIKGKISLVLIAIIIVMLIIPVSLVTLRLPFLQKESRLSNLINRFHLGWELLRKKKTDIAIILLIQITSLLLLSLRFYLIAWDLNISIGFDVIIFINIFGTLLRMNTIFPGNLGLREATAGTVAASFSIDFIDGFLPAATEHILGMFMVFLFGIPFMFKLSKDMRSIPRGGSHFQYGEFGEYDDSSPAMTMKNNSK